MTTSKDKISRLGDKAAGAYHKVEEAFTDTFLTEDEDRPSGYTLKPGPLGQRVVAGYQRIEQAAVDGYKAIEEAAVSSYQKIEDRFVDAFLETKKSEEEER